MDANPCEDVLICAGQVATNCSCGDAGYCGCSIKPFQYGGDTWLVREADPRKEYILARRFVIYDPTLLSGGELDNKIGPEGDKFYTSLALGEPQDGVLLVDSQGQYLNGASLPEITPSEDTIETLDEESKVEQQGLPDAAAAFLNR